MYTIVKFRGFIKALFLNLILVLVFSLSYFYIRREFIAFDRTNRDITFLDCLSTAVTIHVGVGIHTIMPLTDAGRWVMVTQQFTMMIAHCLTVTLLILF